MSLHQARESLNALLKLASKTGQPLDRATVIDLAHSALQSIDATAGRAPGRGWPRKGAVVPDDGVSLGMPELAVV